MTAEITRRQLLAFFGAGAALTAMGPSLSRLGLGRSVAHAAGLPAVTPLRLPHPLTIYTARPSFLATGPGTGITLPPAADPSLEAYTVLDDVVLSPELESYVIVRWGDRPFPNPDDYVGYNHDYTTFLPFRGRGTRDGLLWMNHEYVSWPFHELAPGTPTGLVGGVFESVIGFPFPSVRNREALGEMCYNTGGSLVRVTKRRRRYHLQSGDPLNRRLHGLSGLALNAERTDGYQAVTSWGPRPHQQGDLNHLRATGPAATDVFPLSSDGLGHRIIGTGFNCSGGTTPWDTILSAEENFQGSSQFFIGVQEDVKPDGTQMSYLSGTSGVEFGQVGEKYGWIVEIDPTDAHARKHTALGRFRHENIALRVRAQHRLCAYMGDDRRGGHVWKYVSADVVRHPARRRNSALFEAGTLHVARFDPNGTGVWIPLTLPTPTNPIAPSVLASEVPADLRPALRNGRTRLPRRSGVAGETIDGGPLIVDITNETAKLPDYLNTTLTRFYPNQGALLVDAYLAANLVGGTPCARPEDLEVNPRNDREVIIAFTDGGPGSDGHPDSRIFVVGKYDAALDDTQQSGGLYKIIEDSADGTGLTFRWERLVQGGEDGAGDGGGFAQVDNLVFDSRGDVWGVIDMSTGLHNGFTEGPAPVPTVIDHTTRGDVSTFVGVFGNNWLFRLPLRGPDAGLVIPVAYGPVRCEMTGPTFVGNTLIISVQHPGEDVPVGDGTMLSRAIEMLKLDGTLFDQTRTVPRGSTWPGSNTGDAPPRPATIGITRRRRAEGDDDDDDDDESEDE